MKIELEELAADGGCLLRLGNLGLMFSTRSEAQGFVDRLQGRVAAATLGQGARRAEDLPRDTPVLVEP